MVIFLVLDLDINKQTSIRLITIYGPNKDNPEFYNNINEIIKDSNSDFTVICGDFNLVLDPSKDCFNYKTINNPKARKTVLDFI